MNYLKMLTLVVAAVGLVGSLAAQEGPMKCGCQCKECKKCVEKTRNADPAGKRMKNAPMQGMDRLAAEYPKEIADIQKLKETDAAAAEKQLMELRKKSMNARREEMKHVRELAQSYKENKSEATLKTLKEELGKQYDRNLAVNKASVASLEKKIAEEKAAGKETENTAKQLERAKKMRERLSSESKEKFIEKQLKQMTSDRKQMRERKGGKGNKGAENQK